MSFAKPRLGDLSRLSRLLERDRELPLQSLRERDHAIGERCPAGDDVGRLLFWAGQVAAADAEPVKGRLSEEAVAWLLRIAMFLSGAGAMAGFLFASGRGLVNVFLFLLVFVLLQAVLSVVAALVMWQTLHGRSPLVFPLNPARLIVARLLPERSLPELQSVLRLVVLRYGQELGALFTLGAILAFFLVLGISDFSFVWGSTFQLSDEMVARLAGWLAAPWSRLLPAATVDPALVAATRFHPAVTELGMADVAQMRGWWPFLIVSTICYALLPRLLLWLLSRQLFRRDLRSAITGLPGSERVLARMRAPLVSTGGVAQPVVAAVDYPPDPRLLLVNWANALAPGEEQGLPQLHAVAPEQRLEAGLGSPAADRERVAARLAPPVDRLWVAVKSWEPPMADLADFLGRLEGLEETTLLLVPLAHREVSDARLEDWRGFARELGPVTVLPLEWAATAADPAEAGI